MSSKPVRCLAGGLGLTLSLLLLGAPARAAVVWRADFETGNLSQWNATLNPTKGTRSNIDVVMAPNPVQQGSSSCRVVIHPDDTFQPFNQNRVELHHDSTLTAEGQDTYLSWYFFMPADAQIRNNIGYWESDVTFQNMMTFWVEPKTGGGSTVNFGTGFLGATRRWTADLSVNSWHQLAMNVHWSVNAAVGKVSVWYDGVQVVNAVTVKTKADTNRLFFQTGFHRSSPQPFTETIYIDNFIEADALSDVLGPPPAAMPDGGVRSDGAVDGSGAADTASGGTGGSGSGGNSGGGGAGGAAGGAGGSGAISGSGGSGTVVDARIGMSDAGGRGLQSTDAGCGCAVPGAAGPSASTFAVAVMGLSFLAAALLGLRLRRPRRDGARARS